MPSPELPVFKMRLALPANLGNFHVFNLQNGIVVKGGTIGELFSVEGNLLNKAVLLKFSMQRNHLEGLFKTDYSLKGWDGERRGRLRRKGRYIYI